MSAGYEDDLSSGDTARKPRTRRRFTIGGLLLLVAMFAILFALLTLPAVRSVKTAARRAQCTNNLKMIALALSGYEEEFQALPPAYTVDAAGRPLHSWRTLILPYLEQDSLYQTIDLAKPWNDPANARALETAVSTYRCPQANGPQNTTSYLAVVGPNNVFLREVPRPLADITDAQASTLMVIEAGEENAVPWMAPVDADEALVMNLGERTKLHHAGGTNACFVDGRVTFLKAHAPASVRRAIVSIAGGDAPAFEE